MPRFDRRIALDRGIKPLLRPIIELERRLRELEFHTHFQIGLALHHPAIRRENIVHAGAVAVVLH